MADIFLKSGETGTGVTFSSNFFGRGGAGVETAGITNTAVASTFDGNIEVVTLQGSSNDYQFQQQGNQLKISQGGVLLATIVVQDDANGTRLNFSNGSDVEAKFDAGVIELNGAPVPSSAPGDVTIPGTTPDATGQTFTLTQNADQLTGQPNGMIGSGGTVDNTGDDLIIAGTSVVGGNAVNNLGSGDNVNGGAGEDTLLIIGENAAGDLQVLPTLSNVEVVKAQNLTAGDLNVVLSNATGYQQLWAFNTPAGTGDDTEFLDIRQNAVIGAEDFAADEVRANFSAGAMNSGVLNLAAINSAVVFEITTAEAVNTLNVDATIGASNVNGKDSDIIVDLTGGDQVGSTLNISGDADLILDESDNEFEALSTVNVSSTGALGLDLGDNDEDIAFNGGSGATTLVTGNGDSTITTGIGADSVTVGNGDNTIATGDGKDTVNIMAGGDQTVDLGAGDDLLLTGTELTKFDNLNGGNGIDTLAVNVYTADLVSSDATFDASIANFEVLALGGPIAEGDDLVVDLANLDDINVVFIGSNVAAGTAQAETQWIDFIQTATTDLYGAILDIEGVQVDIPAGLTSDQMADYVAANYGAQIVAAYNSNHPGETLLTLESIAPFDDQVQLNFAQLAGNTPLVSVTPFTGALTSGAVFGAAATTAAGTTEVTEQQTITVTDAPAASGFFQVGGTQIQVFAGETTDQTAARIQAALDATKPTGVASVTVVGSVVTATFTAAAGNAAALAVADPGALFTTDPAVAESRAYVAPVAETQTVAITNGTDSNGGFVTITVGGDAITLKLDADLSIDELGVYLAGQQSAIISEIPAIQAIGYNTLTDTLTFQYTQAAGDVPAVTVANVGGNYDSALNFLDFVDGVDGSADGTLLIDNIASGGTVILGSQNDGLITIAPATDTASDTLNVNIHPNYTSGAGQYVFDNFETLTFKTSGTGQELIDVNGADAKTITVSGTVGVEFDSTFSNLTSFNASSIAGSASAAAKSVEIETTTSADATFVGGAGNDVLTTGAGDDTINGGAGNDVIHGGLGKDTLTGGTGADVFDFTDALQSNGVDTDTIADFDVANDEIDVNLAVTYTGAANGYGAVLTELNGVAGQAVYDTATRSLYIDVNGDADLTDADYKIDFSQNVTLSQSNFA